MRHFFDDVLVSVDRLRRRQAPTVVLATPDRPRPFCSAGGPGPGRVGRRHEEDNLPALRLYERLGFRTSHHYRVRCASSIAGVS